VKNGKLIINEVICYYLNGKLHREDGPAVECISSGGRYWYQNGLCHRLDGPACEYFGAQMWYYQGELVDCESQEEFEIYLRTEKIKAFW